MRYLYVVSNSDWEGYDPTVVEGPYVKNWDEYCQQLIPEAVKLCIADNTGTWIGWSEIKEKLVLMLKTRGFNQPKMKHFNMFGPGIIRNDSGNENNKLSQEDLSLLEEYNQIINEKVYPDREKSNCNL